ncbi:CBS domain-containing protein [Aurantimonas sp. E1-2-R+4]|uniref:CBS domain-containing protein n=1 Tax=Aurantimonas sp. E1-2-R+4 TaxID=3113714 RepID=UPI002F93DED2
MSYQLKKDVDKYDTEEEILDEVKSGISGGSDGPRLTVREFLYWFDAQRRGPNIVAWIDELLADRRLTTVPSYKTTWIDNEISIKIQPEAPIQKGSDAENDVLVEVGDPVLRIGSLPSANMELISVSPDDPISRAVSLMMFHDFSQLPVLTSPREIKGVVSWRHVGERLSSGATVQSVQDCMGTPVVVSDADSFFSTLRIIVENEYVFVRRQDRTIGGIVTTTDLGLQFRQLTEPFLLINEIENQVRGILFRWVKFSKEILGEAQIARPAKSFHDLTFGEYIRIFENKKTLPDPFPMNIDRVHLCKVLNDVREIRNDIMHFSPDPTPADAILKLRRFSSYMQRLQAMI